MRQQPGTIWYRWTIACLAGAVLGDGLADTIFKDADGGLVWYCLGLVLTSIAVGTGQWLVLRASMEDLTWEKWLGPTMFGLTASWVLPLLTSAWLPGSWSVVDASTLALFGAVGGLVLGCAQWTVLSEYTRRAIWWVAANALAGAVMFSLMFRGDFPVLTNLTVSVLVAGLITGVVLVWLMDPAAHKARFRRLGTEGV